jgi:hypothetical protein
MKFLKRHSPSVVGLVGVLGLVLLWLGHARGNTVICVVGASMYFAAFPVLFLMALVHFGQLVAERRRCARDGVERAR